MNTLSLDEILKYAFCPMIWFYEYRTDVSKPQTPEDLTPQALRQALAFYYDGHARDPLEGYTFVWRDWCDVWEATSIYDDLMQYGTGRNEIIALFEDGHITRPDGSFYKAPHMTREYRRRMHAAGLLKIGAALDDVATELGLILPGLPREAKDSPTSAFGDSFSGGLRAAASLGKSQSGLPARDVVLGLQVPFQVQLGEEIRVQGLADLVVRGTRAGSVILEVHDYRRQAAVWAKAVRDLRVIAASLATPVQTVQWESVEHVVYRCLPAEKSFIVRETNPGRLLAVVAAVASGIRSGAIIPRLLTDYGACRSCAYLDQCTGRGWEALDLLHLTMTEKPEEIVTIGGAAAAAQN